MTIFTGTVLVLKVILERMLGRGPILSSKVCKPPTPHLNFPFCYVYTKKRRNKRSVAVLMCIIIAGNQSLLSHVFKQRTTPCMGTRSLSFFLSGVLGPAPLQRSQKPMPKAQAKRPRQRLVTEFHKKKKSVVVWNREKNCPTLISIGKTAMPFLSAGLSCVFTLIYGFAASSLASLRSNPLFVTCLRFLRQTSKGNLRVGKP